MGVNGYIRYGALAQKCESEFIRSIRWRKFVSPVWGNARMTATKCLPAADAGAGVPAYQIGTLVGVRGIPGWVGKIAGGVSVVMFPGGIYPVEHANADGDPEVVWWHADDLIPQSVN